MTYWILTTRGGVCGWPAGWGGCGRLGHHDLRVIAGLGVGARTAGPGSTDGPAAPSCSALSGQARQVSCSGGGALGSQRSHSPFITLCAGHRQDEAPMADDQRVGPVRQRRHLGAEQRGATDHRSGRLLDRRPPDLVNGREIVLRPGTLQFGPRRADIAGKGVALAHDRIDQQLDAERPGDRSGGLQRARVWRGDDAGDPLAGEASEPPGSTCAWPSSVKCGSTMPGSRRVAVKCRLNSLCPWRSRIMAGPIQAGSLAGNPAARARELFVYGAAHPYLLAGGEQ